jgi:hypothetical protein
MLVQRVLALHSVEILFNDLKDGTYFSVVTDTFNQRNTECYPTVVKYFSEKTGVKEFFYEDFDGTATAIFGKVLCKYNLKACNI